MSRALQVYGYLMNGMPTETDLTSSSSSEITMSIVSTSRSNTALHLSKV